MSRNENGAKPSEGEDAKGENTGKKEEFVLGNPELVLRWRLASKTLPLENRHLRALSRRTVMGRPVTSQLIGWAKQHIEWTLFDGAAENPDGVLMIVLDDKGQAVMTVGPYEPIEQPTLAVLAARAQDALSEARKTGVAPETLCVSRDNHLVMGIDRDANVSGAASLISDLASTVGLSVEYDGELVSRALTGAIDFDEAFLVSDEHGVVCASDAGGQLGERFAQGYQKLLDSVDKRHRR
ncbi:MAG: hypothetical protein ACOYJL_06905 [Tractidigestivibacter sp.]|jgi:hypothetical protein|uniref:hypothetical protein n=1 Tax=Tractidigestivibacter sp. TaxID=2847320 RepID=UPI003D8B7590